MSTETEQSTQLHGGRLVAKRLKAHGVTKLFTLSGGHLFSIYDGCREEGIDLVDVVQLHVAGAEEARTERERPCEVAVAYCRHLRPMIMPVQ